MEIKEASSVKGKMSLLVICSTRHRHHLAHKGNGSCGRHHGKGIERRLSFARQIYCVSSMIELVWRQLIAPGGGLWELKCIFLRCYPWHFWNGRLSFCRYLCLGASILILTLGFPARPDSSLVKWAERQALEKSEDSWKHVVFCKVLCSTSLSMWTKFHPTNKHHKGRSAVTIFPGITLSRKPNSAKKRGIMLEDAPLSVWFEQ